MTRWRGTLGAIVADGGTTFRVWAPKPGRVELYLAAEGEPRTLPMEREGEYWVAHVPGIGAGARYGFLLDGEGPFPDPCSRRQPEGVHALSEVVDPQRFQWHDDAWEPPPPSELVIYECHVGTFTPEGTFAAARAKLPYLRDLGVTAVELMPVAAFDGRWNWGYDGVALYAPFEGYGGPDELRTFVDEAHQLGLAVLLDVVYNHFGPAGNYTGKYSDWYLNPRHATPWGPAVNFDGPGAEHVRRFVLENLLHWHHEYHIDGFRFDATHAIVDESPKHILAEAAEVLAQEARTARRPYLIAETNENDVRYLKPRREGGYELDAVWADDFHHALVTAHDESRDGYLGGYTGSAVEIARTVQQGFLYEGQRDPSAGRPRGTPARKQPPYQFVYCIQNHDQVGNRAFGERWSVRFSRTNVRAAALLLLLLPQTPLIFQGQEFGATTPFLYFTDHEPELGKLVTEGRRREFSRFVAFSQAELRDLIPDPQDERTFLRSKLDWSEAETGIGVLDLRYYRRLLELRRSDPVLRAARTSIAPMEAWADDGVVVVHVRTGAGERAICLNLRERYRIDLPGRSEWVVRFHSNDERYGGNGVAPTIDPASRRLMLPAECAAFLAPAAHPGA